MKNQDDLIQATCEVVRDEIYQYPRSKLHLTKTVMEHPDLEFKDSSEAHEVLQIVLFRLIDSGEISKELDAFLGEAYAIPSDMIGRQEILHSLGIPPLKPSKKGGKK